MSERLYGLFNEELAFIREEVRDFGGRFSKVAARLRLSADSIEDPHVSRLIDSFALLTARLRLKIEDEFPEICQSMLQALYPQYLAPVPSTAICQLELDDSGAELTGGFRVERGTPLETDEIDGQACFFKTCFDVDLLPIRVSKTEYLVPPFPFPTEATWSDSVQAAIRIELSAINSKVDWKKMDIRRLRFFLGGATICGNQMYEAIFRDCMGIGLFSEVKPEGVFLPAGCISPAGFGTEQGILNHDARTLSAYQTIWDFFTLPEKFRFVAIDFDSKWSRLEGNRRSIVLYLRRSHPIIQRNISIDSILLGCSPVVNLFAKEAEPISLTESKVEYRVVPSYRTVTGMEVHSIESVTASRPDGEGDVSFLPFHQPSHRVSSAHQDRYWHSSRRRRIESSNDGDRGTEVYLTIVDLHARPRPSDEWTLHVQTLCCNRDLVTHLGVQSKLAFGGGPVRALFRTSPTPTQRPIEREDWLWRLISHLSLNHLSLASDSDGELLREVLRLYNTNDHEEVHKAIEAILGVSYQRSTARIPNTDKGPGICRGLDIHLEIDDERLEGIGAYLFMAVLDQFFSGFATINSFTRLIVKSKGGSHVLYRGKPKSGTKYLI